MKIDLLVFWYFVTVVYFIFRTYVFCWRAHFCPTFSFYNVPAIFVFCITSHWSILLLVCTHFKCFCLTSYIQCHFFFIKTGISPVIQFHFCLFFFPLQWSLLVLSMILLWRHFILYSWILPKFYICSSLQLYMMHLAEKGTYSIK